ncbi:MAG TPA: phenylalanine--tRNA ligase subunit alpha [Candidatus Saccharimonadales bacterium]|nr:phenylalanine--tRNA ligase subunit alpha [Candidatus Saccharimonadales bacterium]
MNPYQAQIDHTVEGLKKRFVDLADKRDIFKDPDFKMLYGMIKRADPEHRPLIGKLINEVKLTFEQMIADAENAEVASKPLDPTAPFDVNVAATRHPALLPLPQGSQHPLVAELENALSIFRHMGFETVQARELDDEYHMFDSLNFPPGHPARDNWDSFVTDDGLMPIAHTTAMDNRFLLNKTPPIAVVTAGRCFRNEDVDATHDHTFYQLDGLFVAEGATLGDMLGVLKVFFENFFGQSLKIKTQPAHFPFVEPGLEFLIEKPKHIGGSGDWLEVLGCGMVHPNVLREGGIDPAQYQGFAWGGGFDRLVMLKYGIEDIRHFHSGRLEFLKEFANAR